MMGSFAATCCVSGLPIEAGDEVRFFLLQSSPYSEGGDYASAPHVWYIRTPPLRAKYNDYGSVEDVEAGAMRDVWTEQLAIDLVEKGVGDNSVHDVAARKGMPFDALLEAALEERLEVSRPEVRHGRKQTRVVPRGIPTLRRIESAVTKAGGAIGTGDGELIVDSKRWGEVRIRAGGYGIQDGALAPLAKRLGRRYAVMLSCGSGSYSHGGEITVRPKPGTKTKDGHSVTLRDREKRVRMYLRQTMVREDVWQALLGGERQGSAAFRAAARSAWEKSRGVASDEWDWAVKGALRNNPIEWVIGGNPSIGGVGLDTAWRLMVQKPDLPDDDRDQFLDTIGEVALVQQRLMSVRYKWAPSPVLGPQFGEWGAHVDIMRALLAVAEKRKAEWDARRAKWDTKKP